LTAANHRLALAADHWPFQSGYFDSSNARSGGEREMTSAVSALDGGCEDAVMMQ